jgi:hypothetical protein
MDENGIPTVPAKAGEEPINIMAAMPIEDSVFSPVVVNKPR